MHASEQTHVNNYAYSINYDCNFLYDYVRGQIKCIKSGAPIGSLK